METWNALQIGAFSLEYLCSHKGDRYIGHYHMHKIPLYWYSIEVLCMREILLFSFDGGSNWRESNPGLVLTCSWSHHFDPDHNPHDTQHKLRCHHNLSGLPWNWNSHISLVWCQLREVCHMRNKLGWSLKNHFKFRRNYRQHIWSEEYVQNL